MLTFDPKNKKASLKITKSSDREEISIQKLIFEPKRNLTNERKAFDIIPFDIQAWNELDLTPWWKDLTNSDIKPSILSKVDKIDFMEVNAAKYIK